MKVRSATSQARIAYMIKRPPKAGDADKMKHDPYYVYNNVVPGMNRDDGIDVARHFLGGFQSS